MTYISKEQECVDMNFSNKSNKICGMLQMFSWARRKQMTETGGYPAVLTEVKWIPYESRPRGNTRIEVTHSSSEA